MQVTVVACTQSWSARTEIWWPSASETFDNVAFCGLWLSSVRHQRRVLCCFRSVNGSNLKGKARTSVPGEKVFHSLLALPNGKPHGAHTRSENCQILKHYISRSPWLTEWCLSRHSSDYVNFWQNTDVHEVKTWMMGSCPDKQEWQLDGAWHVGMFIQHAVVITLFPTHSSLLKITHICLASQSLKIKSCFLTVISLLVNFISEMMTTL